MTDRISLTAAELAFLLSAHADESPSPAGRLLGFGAQDRTDAVLGAGLGSLLLRHLAAPTADQRVELTPAVAAVANGLAKPWLCVQVGLVADQLTDGALLFESDAVRFLLAPRAYRCFDVTGVDQSVDRRDVLIRLGGSFLERYGPGVASFTVPTAPDPDSAWVTVALAADGTWTVATGRAPDAPIEGLAAGDALARLSAELGGLLPGHDPALV